MGIYSISSSNAMKTFREKIQEKTEVVLPDNAKNRDYKIVAISNQDANNELLFKQLKMGFKPKWFCVLRMREPNTSKILKRRKDPILLEEDIASIKNSLYSELYSSKWEKKRNRAKSIWGIEYQRNPDNPHINLLIEELPFPYNDYRNVLVLMDRLLPQLCKSLSNYKKDTDIQPVSYSEGICDYITKESGWENKTILHNLCDYYENQLELSI